MTGGLHPCLQNVNAGTEDSLSDPVLAQRAMRKVSWRFGLPPCSQNAHTQKVLVRCAQSGETKPHSPGEG